MFGKTKRLEDDLAELGTKYAALQQQYKDMELQRDSAQWQIRHLGTSHSDLVITRTRERDSAQRLLRSAEDQLADARQRLADRPPATEELRGTRRALMLSERARASLEAQLATVQAANDALSREAVDRAGNLTAEVARG